MNLLAATCWLSRDITEGTETRSIRVRRVRNGEELTARNADFSFPIHSLSIQHPGCAQEPLGKSRSAAGMTSQVTQHNQVLPQAALLGTVPPLELSRVVPLR